MSLVGIISCIGLSFLYVASLYVWEFKSPDIALLNRDHPSVIRRRIASVFVSTVVCVLVTDKYTNEQFRLPQLRWGNLLKTMGQVLVLMMGPIAQTVSLRKSLPCFWVAVRNLIVAPISEEIVFRHCFLRILIASGISSRIAVGIAPLIFALAHVHHNIYSLPLSVVILSVAHTCVFGWIAFYFLLNRSIWDSILAHTICNAIGLPAFRSDGSRALTLTYITGLVSFIVSL